MAHFDLHEQEQLSNLKYFWQKGGKYIVGLVVVAIVAYMVNVGWNMYKNNQSSAAAEIYTQFTEVAAGSRDLDKMLKFTQELQSKYAVTEYSSMASMQSAEAAWKEHKLDIAANLLNWLIDNSKDQGLVNVARVRIADILIDEQKFDKALKQLQQPHDSAFDVIYYMKRGDLYVAKGDLNRARDAYKEALQKAGQDSNVAQEVQLRLDVLGGN